MKTIQSTYTFDASAQTVACDDFGRYGLNRILMIVNATRGSVIYNPSNTATKGTLAGSVLTLDFDTTSHADTDVLQIFTDDTDTAATEQSLSQLVQVMTEFVERMDFYPDGQGSLRVVLGNSTGSLTSLSNVGTLSSIGNSGQNLDNIWRLLMQPSVELQNSLFPVT